MTIHGLIKISVVSFSLFLTICISGASAADTYAVDPDHSYILFRVKHLNIGYSFGRFNAPEGIFRIDDGNPANSTVEMTVKAGMVDTNVEKRDKHLRGADFFDVKQHPKIKFKSTSVKRIEKDLYEVVGDLTLLGITRPIIAKVIRTGEGRDPWKKYRQGYETKFTIKRSEWGMDFLLSGVSDEVNLTVSVEGIRK